MKTMSSEQDRLEAQEKMNQKRRQAWATKKADALIRFLDGLPVPVNQIPRSMWTRRQAD